MMEIRRWSIVNKNSMYLICYTEESWQNGDVVYARVIWAIRAFWVWKLLYGRKK